MEYPAKNVGHQSSKKRNPRKWSTKPITPIMSSCTFNAMCTLPYFPGSWIHMRPTNYDLVLGEYKQNEISLNLTLLYYTSTVLLVHAVRGRDATSLELLLPHFYHILFKFLISQFHLFSCVIFH